MNTPTREITAGEYYLWNIPEMATGFLFGDDGQLKFFVSHGALDRVGSGTWREEAGHLVLNSVEWPGHDFKMVESFHVNDDKVRIKIDEHPDTLPFVFGSLSQNKEDNTWQPADDDGIIEFIEQPLQTISLIFEFCPERQSHFLVQDTNHNHFVFKYAPWLTEVFFKDFVLLKTDAGLLGKHPMLAGGEFLYEKK